MHKIDTNTSLRHCGRTKTIQFRLWMYFLMISLFMLVFFSGTQIIFYTATYKNMKSSELEKTAKKMLEQFGDRKDIKVFSSNLKQTAYATGTNIQFFKVDYTVINGEVEFKSIPVSIVDSSPIFTQEIPTLVNTTEILDNIIIGKKFFIEASEKNEFTYYENPRLGNTNESIAIFGAKIDDHIDGKVYFHMSMPVTLSDSATTIWRRQILLTAIICIVAGTFVSWFASSRISRPIKDISIGAEKLAKGDYSVVFDGSGLLEVQYLADTLNYATEEISKTEDLRREFLANVSHDLKTPITIIKGYAETIRDISGENSVKRNAHSQVIIDESDKLTRLITDILDLSRMQAGTIVTTKEDLDLSVIAKSVLERFDIYSTRDGYKFEFDSVGDCTVIADTKQMEQALYNLIGNAINYTGEDKKVKVEVVNTGKVVRCNIIDSGKGIAKEDIDLVWDKYYRTGLKTRKFVGTGLGLSIVKTALTSNDCVFGIESEVDKGSTFWFELNSTKYLKKQEQEQQLLKPQKQKKIKNKIK